MNDAMQVVLGNLFAERRLPFNLWCVEWKEDKKVRNHSTLTVKPYPDLVKAALINKSTYAQFRKFVEMKIWDVEDSVFYGAFSSAVYDAGLTMWNGEIEARLQTWTFSLCLHDTHYAGTTISCRQTDTPGVLEFVAHYGVGDTAATEAMFVATVPPVMYIWDRKCKLEQFTEKLLWKRDTGLALHAWLAAQHQERGGTARTAGTAAGGEAAAGGGDP